MSAPQRFHDSFEGNLRVHPQSSASCVRKRLSEESEYDKVEKRTCSEFGDDLELSSNSQSSSNFLGFHTAGLKREIKVSEEALQMARTRLSSALEADSVANGGINNLQTDDNVHLTGRVTVDSEEIAVIPNSSTQTAKIRTESKEFRITTSAVSVPDVENWDPSEPFVMRSSSSAKRPTNSFTRPTYHAPNSGAFVSPIIRNCTRSVQTPSKGVTFLVNKYSRDRSSSSAFSGPSKHVISDDRNSFVDKKVSSRITCIRDLRKCQSTTVDFLGIIVGNMTFHQNLVGGTQILKVADRYGESVFIEILSSSIPSNISPGVVISIDCALIRCTEEDIRLIVNEASFVDLEPSDPEAECLHRLYATGLFDKNVFEDNLAFDHSALRMIGRLNEYPGEISFVMARICAIDLDSIVYLGCTTCKRSITLTSKVDALCHHCQNRKARYFYSLSMELADLSGIVTVNVSNEVAEKLFGKPAGGMVKMDKTTLHRRVSSLYFRPMLFRISEQESRWYVDAWKQLDICKFEPFLRNIAVRKGYK